MNKSLTKNYIFNTSFQVLSIIIPIIAAPYVSRALGPNSIGNVSYLTSVTTIFVIFSTFGTTLSGQRRVASCREDKEKLSEAFWNTVFLRLVLSFVSLVLYSFYFLKFEKDSVIALVLAMNILNVVFDISWFFQGIENFQTIFINSFVAKILGTVSIFVFVKSPNDTWIYVLINVVSQVLVSFSFWPAALRMVDGCKNFSPFSNFKETVEVFLPTIAMQVYLVLDKGMIWWITQSQYLNGCYEESEKIARLALTVIISLSTVVLPRIANLYGSNDVSEAKTLIYKSFRIVWFLSIPMTLGLFAISPILIPLYLGNQFEESVRLLQVFSFIIIPVSCASLVGQSFLVSSKQQNVYTVSIVVAAISNFCLNMWLIRRCGAFGAAMASVCAEIIGITIQLFYCFASKQFRSRDVFSSSVKYLISALIMFIVVSLIVKRVCISVINLLIVTFVGVAVYVLGLLLLRDVFLISCVSAFLHKDFVDTV